MKHISSNLGKGIVAGLALAAASSAFALQVDYSNTTGSFIQFNGNSTFTFAPAANNFKVTSGTAAGDLGEITGTYTIGAGSGTAPVTGSGVFRIHDGHGFDLKGTLTWVDIHVAGTGGTMNLVGDVNLTGVTYGGLNSDLLALVGSDINVMTFQFVPALTLNQLRTTFHHTSFSGSVVPVAVPDGGLTLALVGGAVSALALLRRKVGLGAAA